MARTVLTLLPQFPLDPAGGAVRCVDSISRFLASSGFRAVTLATFASEHARGALAIAPLDALRSLGLKVHVEPASPSSAPVARFRRADSDYILLDTGAHDFQSWQHDAALSRQFDELLLAVLRSHKPDVVHTYGATPGDRGRQSLCRKHGAAVVLSVRNHGYYEKRAFEHTDAVLTCSEFLSDRLREKTGIESTPLPVPMNFADILAPTHDPVFTTFINPSHEKGVLFFARLAEELSSTRPDIPLMVVESRGTAGTLAAAARAGNIDLTRHQNIMISPGVPTPRDIYAVSRIVLAPSVFEEPAGRVPVEAMINGVVPIASDRGGLPETMRGGGFNLPLPASCTLDSRTPPSPAEVAPWKDLIIRLCDDEPFFQQHSARTRQTAEFYRESNLAPMYANYFRAVQNRNPSQAP